MKGAGLEKEEAIENGTNLANVIQLGCGFENKGRKRNNTTHKAT